MIIRKIAVWSYNTLHSLAGFIPYLLDYFRFQSNRKTQADTRFNVKLSELYPCLNDNTGKTPFDAHYIYHPAWAARILAKTGPEEHVDISSSLSFVTLVSSFIMVRFYDYRPAELNLTNLSSGAVDIVALPFADGSISSLSCMHVVEHIGLGRYGDPINSKGDLLAVMELKRVLKPGGDLLFVVPVGGDAKIMYNAHRIYTYDLVMKMFHGFELMDFSLVSDTKGHVNDFISPASKENSDEATYGCGCFWFRKIV